MNNATMLRNAALIVLTGVVIYGAIILTVSLDKQYELQRQITALEEIVTANEITLVQSMRTSVDSDKPILKAVSAVRLTLKSMYTYTKLNDDNIMVNRRKVDAQHNNLLSFIAKFNRMEDRVYGKGKRPQDDKQCIWITATTTTGKE